MVAITQNSSGKIIWLEKGHLGDRPSGLAHIIDAHGADFAKQNISEAEIPQYIMTAVKYDTIVDYQGRGQGRPVYEFTYEASLGGLQLLSATMAMLSALILNLYLRRKNNEHLKILS